MPLGAHRRPYFGGAVADLAARPRRASRIPVLRKDFTIDEMQVVRDPGDRRRRDPADRGGAARRRAARRPPRRSPSSSGLAVLVEAHDDAELDRALAIGAADRRRERPRPRHVRRGPRRRASGSPRVIPADVIAVAESAIRSAGDAAPHGATRASTRCWSARRSCAPTTRRGSSRDARVPSTGPRETRGDRAIRPPGTTRSRPRGSTCCRSCPRRCSRRCTRAPRSRSAPTTSRRCSRWALIAQEVSAEPWIDIPGEVLDILRLWRPTPLVRAERLERALGTPARIYFKDESVSPAGSHKPNTAVPQAFYNKAEGVHAARHRDRRRSVGDGAVVRVRAVRPRVQGVHGAGVVRAEAVPPGADGDVGRARSCRRRSTTRPPRLARPRDQRRGARRRDAATTRTTRSARCSTTCCCTRRSSASKRRSSSRSPARTRPDVVIGCCGGGSNLGGIALPFVPDADVRLVAVEPSSCPTLTEGRFDYDFGDTAGHDAAAADVHARPRLHPAVDPRRRAALPR